MTLFYKFYLLFLQNSRHLSKLFYSDEYFLYFYIKNSAIFLLIKMNQWELAAPFFAAVALLFFVGRGYLNRPENFAINQTDDFRAEKDQNRVVEFENVSRAPFGGECKEPPAYVFLKKHKTASTTFRQLMSHYARYKVKFKI